MLAEQLREFSIDATNKIQEGKISDEISTAHEIVHPLLQILGYDPASALVKENVGDIHAPDLQIPITDNQSIAVEIKTPQTGLGEHPREQLEGILKSYESAAWGILTNGRQYRIYAVAETSENRHPVLFEESQLEQFGGPSAPMESVSAHKLSSLHTLSSNLIEDPIRAKAWSETLHGSLGNLIDAYYITTEIQSTEENLDHLHEFLLDHSSLSPEAIEGTTQQFAGVAAKLGDSISPEYAGLLSAELPTPFIEASNSTAQPEILSELFSSERKKIYPRRFESLLTGEIEFTRDQISQMSSIVGDSKIIFEQASDAYSEAVNTSYDVSTDGGDRIEITDIVACAGRAATGIASFTAGINSGNTIMVVMGATLIFEAYENFPETEAFGER